MLHAVVLSTCSSSSKHVREHKVRTSRPGSPQNRAQGRGQAPPLSSHTCSRFPCHNQLHTLELNLSRSLSDAFSSEPKVRPGAALYVLDVPRRSRPAAVHRRHFHRLPVRRRGVSVRFGRGGGDGQQCQGRWRRCGWLCPGSRLPEAPSMGPQG